MTYRRVGSGGGDGKLGIVSIAAEASAPSAPLGGRACVVGSDSPSDDASWLGDAGELDDTSGRLLLHPPAKRALSALNSSRTTQFGCGSCGYCRERSARSTVAARPTPELAWAGRSRECPLRIRMMRVQPCLTCSELHGVHPWGCLTLCRRTHSSVQPPAFATSIFVIGWISQRLARV